MKVWKLVWKKPDGSYVSWFANLHSGDKRPAKEHQKLYRIGEKTIRSRGMAPLFAFESQEDAEWFAAFENGRNPKWVPAILLCDARISKTVVAWRSSYSLDFKEFWTQYKTLKTDMSIPDYFAHDCRPVPAGTVFCASITPIKEVEVCKFGS